MNVLRASSEDEMILEFLKAEYRSERFSDSLQNAMRELSSDEGMDTGKTESCLKTFRT